MSSREQLVGRELPRWTFPVEAGKIREFAKAVHAADPLHHDRDAARAAGFRDIVAPLTFSAAGAHWRPDRHLDSLGLDLRRVLAGGARWSYHAPLVAGDVLEVSEQVSGIRRTRSSRGGMSILTLTASFLRDGLAVQTVETDILLLDQSPADREDGS